MLDDAVELDSAMDLQVLTMPPQFSDATEAQLEPWPLLGLPIVAFLVILGGYQVTIYRNQNVKIGGERQWTLCVVEVSVSIASARFLTENKHVPF